jgi:hypothetical protein
MPKEREWWAFVFAHPLWFVPTADPEKTAWEPTPATSVQAIAINRSLAVCREMPRLK